MEQSICQRRESGYCVCKQFQTSDFSGQLRGSRYRCGKSNGLLIFDVVIPFGFKMEDEDVTKEIQRRIMREIGENYFAVIQVDKMYYKILLRRLPQKWV